MTPVPPPSARPACHPAVLAWPRLAMLAALLVAFEPPTVHAQTMLDAEDLACRSPLPATAPVQITERFLSAECADCWGDAAAPADGSAVMDWIVPTQADAPLAPAAAVEATERLTRLALSTPATGRPTVLTHRPASVPVTLQVMLSTVPIGGYVALQLTSETIGAADGADPLRGFLALAERVPAGTEGTPVERWLLRTVVGPLALAGTGDARTREVRATRVPETAQPERLRALGWIEDAQGRIVHLVRTRCKGDDG